jgi:hypothetical protein
MTIVLTKPTEQQVRHELRVMDRASRKLTKSPKTARAFLVKHGFLTKDGKQLHARYGG